MNSLRLDFFIEISLILLCIFDVNCDEHANKVRLGYSPNLTHSPALVAIQKGIFKKKLGKTVLETKTFNAGPSLIEALFVGEIDIGYIGPSPTINGYVKSGGKALKIIAGSSSGGALFVIAEDSEIKKITDLKGKKIASPQMGNTQDIALRKFLLDNGLKTVDKGGDVHVIPMENSSILTMFKRKAIDGAWVPEPWGTRLIKEAGAKLFLDERTLWPNGKFVSSHIIARTEFIEKHPDLVKKFIEGHLEAVDFIKNNFQISKKIINDEIKKITTKPIPEEILSYAMINMEITYDPLRESLMKSANNAFALGFLGKNKPDLSGIYDLRILNSILEENGFRKIEEQ